LQTRIFDIRHHPWASVAERRWATPNADTGVGWPSSFARRDEHLALRIDQRANAGFGFVGPYPAVHAADAAPVRVHGPRVVT